jgi:hypothetical protein
MAPVALPEPVPTPKPEAVPANLEPLTVPAAVANLESVGVPDPAPQSAPPAITAAPEPRTAADAAPADVAAAEAGATESLQSASASDARSTEAQERAAERVTPRDLPTSLYAGMAAAKPTRAAATRVKPSLRVPFAGAWAASPEACTADGQRDGHLLTHISARRARAGSTSCSFRKIRRNGNIWDVAAVCSDGETKWSSDVQLSWSRGNLTWTSQKGTTNYVRCRRG